MRRHHSLLLLAALGGATLFVSCSKKAASPTAPATPVCSVSPTSLDFGTVAAGQTATRTFVVSNSGGGVLTGTISVPAGPFSLVGSAGYSLSAGQSVTETVRFTWQQAGAASATASTGASCANVTCSAVAGTSTCGVSPTSLSFGTLRVGDSRDLGFSVSNSGTTTFIATAQETCADWSFVGYSSWYVDPGATVNFTLHFAPTRGGPQTCAVALGGLCSGVTATGTGEASPCYVSPLVLDFGTVRLNEYATQSFVLRNDGTTQLTGQLDIPSGDNLCGSFYLREGTPDYDLAPGASRTFLIAIQPRVVTPALSCQISSGNAPCAQVTCQAAVEPPAFGSCSGWSVTPSTLDFGDVPIGQSVTRTIHITAPADCIYSGAQLDAIVSGPDFTFDDGTQVKHVGLDLGVDWTFDVRFTPTVEGEETFALVTYRACGPPGASGFPCQGVLGRGAGVRTAAQNSAWPGVWRPTRR